MVISELRSPTQRGGFAISWPLIVGVCSALGVLMYSTHQSLGDPDTFLHLKIGQWILAHHSVPMVDYFSHSLPGEGWIAHEWLSELIFAMVYQFGSWAGLVLLTASFLAITLALLVRFLVKRMPPIYAILFTALAFFALSTHLLARPHILVWPLLLIWCGALINAQEHHRRPPYSLIFLMILWVNLHGSFVFGLAFMFPIALEAILTSPDQQRRALMWQWISFIGLALLSSLLNPQGFAGAIFPFQVLNLQHWASIVEWMPYRFSGLNPLELILGVYFTLALLGLLKLPAIRILILLGLIHMSLAHNRYVSVLGLVSPLLIASAFGKAYLSKSKEQIPSKMDHFFLRLNRSAGLYAMTAGIGLMIGAACIGGHMNRYAPPDSILAKEAIDAVQRSGHSGNVLNDYQFGGSLIYRGIPVLIDGRADLYDQKVMGPYVDAMIDGKAEAFDRIIEQYQLTWTLLVPDSPAIAYFDHQAGWQRYYADPFAVVYFKIPGVN